MYDQGVDFTQVTNHNIQFKWNNLPDVVLS